MIVLMLHPHAFLKFPECQRNFPFMKRSMLRGYLKLDTIKHIISRIRIFDESTDAQKNNRDFFRSSFTSCFPPATMSTSRTSPWSSTLFLSFLIIFNVALTVLIRMSPFFKFDEVEIIQSASKSLVARARFVLTNWRC